MRRSSLNRFGFIILLTCLLLVFGVIWMNTNALDPPVFNQNEIDSVLKIMEETRLTNQILDALIMSGYKPTGQIAGQVYSANHKELFIMMKDVNGDLNVKADIQSIVNRVSTLNGLGTFKVSIIEVD